MYWLYILQCSDNTLYTGITNDLTSRLKKHNLGIASKYTAARLPARIVYTESLPDKSSALKREIAVKKLKRIEKLALVERKKHFQ